MFNGNTNRGRFVMAIAFAEGCLFKDGSYNTHSLPYRLNNPCDLKITSSQYHSHMDSSGKLLFQDIGTGWNAGQHQVDLMFDNKSAIYNNQMSIQDVANHYAKEHLTPLDQTNADNWAKNVALFLGVSTTTILQTLDDVPETSVTEEQPEPTPEVVPTTPTNGEVTPTTTSTNKWGKAVN